MTETKSDLSPKDKKVIGITVLGGLTLLWAAWWVAVAIFAVSVGVWGWIAWPAVAYAILSKLGKSVSIFKEKTGQDSVQNITVNVSNGMTVEEAAEAASTAVYWKLASER